MISDHRQLLDAIRQRPGMYLLEDSFASHVVLAEGINLGSSGALLAGFREFLQTRIGQESSLYLSSLVLWLVEPIGHKAVDFRSLPDELNRAAIGRWYDLLDEFLAIRNEPGGDVQIYGEYLGMLKKRGIPYHHAAGTDRLGTALDAVGGVEPPPPSPDPAG